MSDTTTDVAIPAQAAEAAIRLPIGLIVATGDTVPTRDGKSTRPVALDHFRPKAGQLEQYAEAVGRFHDVYGADASELDDVMLFSNLVWESLDIRLRAWGTSGLRILGKTNFAAIPDKDDFLAAIERWDDEIALYPLDEAEVKAATRDEKRAKAWQGEALETRLRGPDDPKIKKYEIRVETTLRFGLPRVLGLGTVALYSTTSRNNRDNLRDSLWFAAEAFRGHLIGIHFRLAVRPRRTRYFDEKKRARVSTDTYEVVLDTPWTLQEALDAMKEQSAVFGGAPLELPAGEFFAGTEEREQAEEEARLLGMSRDLAAPVDEDTTIREEPSAIERPDEAQLNRLAGLLEAFGGDVSVYLVGSFGVETVEQLTADQATQAEAALRRLLESQGKAPPEPASEEETIEDGVWEEPTPPTDYDAMMPESVRAEFEAERAESAEQASLLENEPKPEPRTRRKRS